MPTSSDTPTEIVTWARDLYTDAVDQKDAAGFAAVFTDDAWLRFGNADPILGRENIEAAIAQFFTYFADLRHEFTAVSYQGDVIFLEAIVTYTRHDGGIVVVPAMTVFHMSDTDRGRLAHRCQIYVDLAPLFAPGDATTSVEESATA